MAKKPTSSPWNRRPVRKSGKKKFTPKVVPNARPRRRRYFKPPSYLALGLIIACVLLGLSYMDKFGLGYTDPEIGFDKRAASVLKGTITHVRDGDTFEINGIPVRISALDCAENSTPEGKKITRFAKKFLGKQAVCELTGAKTYDRVVGYCSIAGKDFARTMMNETSCKLWAKYDVWDRY